MTFDPSFLVTFHYEYHIRNRLVSLNVLLLQFKNNLSTNRIINHSFSEWIKNVIERPKLGTPLSYLDSRTSLDRNIFHQFSSITHSMQTHTVCSTLASSAAITLHREDKGHRAQPWSLPPVCENVTLHACKRCLARGQDPFTWFVEGERLNETGGRVRGGGGEPWRQREKGGGGGGGRGQSSLHS